MMVLENVCKKYRTRTGVKTVLEHINLQVVKGEKLGILGGNGAGKSTLIRLMSGAELPTSGKVKRSMSVSWPLAFGGAFQGALTGYDNIRFICRVYGVNIPDAVESVREFSELGNALGEPVKHYSSGMRARLAFGISLAVEFDCFLIDEVVAVGDARFQEKCQIELFDKRADRTIILVSHNPHYIKQYCNSAAVISDGKLRAFDDINEAFSAYDLLVSKSATSNS